MIIYTYFTKYKVVLDLLWEKRARTEEVNGTAHVAKSVYDADTFGADLCNSGLSRKAITRLSITVHAQLSSRLRVGY